MTIGLFAFYFLDYGAGFKVYDKDGQQPFPYHIEHISNSDPGVVRVIKEKPLTYQTGDFVCIHEAEGMTEVNGNDPRPIRILSPFEFQIEDTTYFQKYVKGGLVQLQKVPQRVAFQSMEDQLDLPLVDLKYASQHLTALATVLTLIQAIESAQKLSDDDIIVRARQLFTKMAASLE